MISKIKIEDISDSLICACLIHDKNGFVIHLNDEAEKFFSIPKSQIYEKRNHLTDWKLFDKDGKELKVSEFPVSYVLEKKISYPPTLIGFCPPGTSKMKWGVVRAGPILDEDNTLTYVFVSFNDQTFLRDQNKILESNLEEIRLREKKLHELAAVVETTDYVVIITDDKENIKWVNHGFSRLTGYSFEEVLGKKPRDLLQGKETSLETRKKIRKALEERRPVTCEILNYSKSGKKYWLSLNIQPIFDNEGKLTSFVAIEFDLTQRKKFEEDLKGLNNSLHKTLNERDSLYSVMAHDLRSPFNSLIGISSELVEEFDSFSSAEIYEHLKIINETSIDTLKTIEGILKWSKDYSSLNEVNISVENISETLQNACTILKASANEKSIKIKNHFEYSGLFKTDHRILSVIVRNLINNAIKYSHEDDEVLVTSEGDENKIIISIIDHGIGMDEKTISDILEGKISSSQKGTNNEIGSGFGLKFVVNFLNRVGNKLEISSVPGQGSKFTIILKSNN